MNYCTICKCHDIYFDNAKGENVCGECGNVLETNGIVSQVFSNFRNKFEKIFQFSPMLLKNFEKRSISPIPKALWASLFPKKTTVQT